MSALLKSSLRDYVTYSREGDKCRFRFKHDTYLSDTDQDVSISADVKLSLVEGKGVSVTAIYGLSGTPGFTDTIRGYVSAGDLSNVIVSWFKTLSYDGKARSYYIDAWDDFSTALSSISEHPGFASAVSDATSPNSSLVGGTPISSSKDALDSLYTDIVTTALRHYKIEFRDIIRREDYFTLDYVTVINIQASEVKPLRQDVDQRLASVSLRAAADGSDKISVSVSFSLQAMSKEVPYVSQYAGSGYVNTAEFSLTSDKEISTFVSSFLSFLGRLQANGYVYDHYCKEFEKFASKVSYQYVVSDAALGVASLRGLTPIESTFGGSTLYRVLLWQGRGYFRDVFYVRADSEESALEALSTYLIKEGLTSYYYTEDEYANYLSQAGITEEEDTSYLYLDGTMEGAPYPIYLLSENLSIEKV